MASTTTTTEAPRIAITHAFDFGGGRFHAERVVLLRQPVAGTTYWMVFDTYTPDLATDLPELVAMQSSLEAAMSTAYRVSRTLADPAWSFEGDACGWVPDPIPQLA